MSRPIVPIVGDLQQILDQLQQIAAGLQQIFDMDKSDDLLLDAVHKLQKQKKIHQRQLEALAKLAREIEL